MENAKHKSNRTAPVRKARSKADTFPLFQRSDGRWCKKIGGKHEYFGRDKDEALERYKRFVGMGSLGLDPAADAIGTRELFNRYLTSHQQAMLAGEIGARTLSDSASTLRRAAAILGDRPVSSLGAADFATLKTRWSKGRSIITVSGDVRRLKAAFRWGLNEGLLPKLPQYGSGFKPAPARAVRLAKSQRAALMFEADELRLLVDSAGVQLKAIVLLGANAALLPVDIARLEFEEIDLDRSTLRQARGKTGVDRQCWLWPQTVEAVKAAIEARPKPAKPEYRDLVFLTESGNPMVRTRTPAKAAKDIKKALNATVINRVTSDFRGLMQDCKVYRHRRGFGALRHGFLTIAEQGRDFAAVACVMGHVLPGVGSHYRERVGADRIKAACEIVRTWLFGAEPPAPKKRKAK